MQIDLATTLLAGSIKAVFDCKNDSFQMNTLKIYLLIMKSNSLLVTTKSFVALFFHLSSCMVEDIMFIVVYDVYFLTDV